GTLGEVQSDGMGTYTATLVSAPYAADTVVTASMNDIQLEQTVTVAFTAETQVTAHMDLVGVRLLGTDGPIEVVLDASASLSSWDIEWYSLEPGDGTGKRPGGSHSLIRYAYESAGTYQTRLTVTDAL